MAITLPGQDARTNYIYKRPYLYPKQEAIFFNSARYSICEASTKSGKTHGAIVWLFEQTIQGKAGQNFWWVAPSYKQSKIAYRRMKRAVPDHLYKANDTDLELHFVNGTTMSFLTGERPDNLYGEDVYAAVVDEATRCREEAWHALRSTLTATSGPVRIIGNVKGRKNWCYRLARRAERGDSPDYVFHKLTAQDAIDAGIFSADELADAKSSLPEDIFNELYFAVPAADEGNPFGMEAIAACTVETLAEGEVVAWGWDLAKSVDYTVGIGLNEDGHVARFIQFRDSWHATINRILAATGYISALVDSTGVGDPIVEELQLRGGENFKPFHFSATSKQQLMEGLAVAIQEQAIRFPEGPIVTELSEFEYTYSRNLVRYSAPAGFHDDCVIALALAWANFTRARHRRAVPLVGPGTGGSKEGHALD